MIEATRLDSVSNGLICAPASPNKHGKLKRKSWRARRLVMNNESRVIDLFPSVDDHDHQVKQDYKQSLIGSKSHTDILCNTQNYGSTMMGNETSEEFSNDELLSKHGDEDCISSLGDASPMNNSEQRQKRRQKRTIYRLAFFFGTAISSLIFSILNNKLSTYTQRAPGELFAGVEAKVSMAAMQELHIHHVASGMAHAFQPVSPSVWCIDARLKYEQAKRRPMGLCYLKIPRAASSTLSGINQVCYQLCKLWDCTHNRRC